MASLPWSVDEIARRLTLTRSVLAQSQAEWCRRVGIEPNTWNNYERGSRRISLDAAIKVCQMTDITLDWIYRGVLSAVPFDIAKLIQDRTLRVIDSRARDCIKKSNAENVRDE